MPELVVENVSIAYELERGDPVIACEGISFTVGEGELVSLVGRSGCGKTSLLYAIDGLLETTEGEIRLDNAPIRGPSREKAVVFQSPALFPWRTVLDNVKYGSRRLLPKREADENARALVRLVGLEGFERRRPYQLSGGMQQRVNLARALAVSPKLLLLDEPFSALDALTRETMQGELLRIWNSRRESGQAVTMIFVTHDIREAVFLSDRIVVFTPRPGRLEAIVDIDLPRPRDRHVKQTPEYQGYVDRLLEMLLVEGE